MWIVGDCQGEFDAVMKVMVKIPKDEKVIFVGDIVDRGPKSKELVAYIREAGHTCLMGNHEHMLIDFVHSRQPGAMPFFYDPENYYANGGCATLKSYTGTSYWKYTTEENCKQLYEDVEWMKTLPLKMVFDDLIITHAPMMHGKLWSDEAEKNPKIYPDFFWNRYHIEKNPEGKFQIFGHNGRICVFGTDKPNGSPYQSKKPWGLCIDDTKAGNISAVHWPTMEIIQEKY